MKSSPKTITLGDIGITLGGLNGKTKNDFGSGSPFITYKNVFSNTFTDLSDVGHVKVRPGEKQTSIKRGDILFTVSSETPDEVGMSSVVLDDPGIPVYLNSFCFAFRLNEQDILDSRFAGYLFRGPDFRRAMKASAKGTTRFNLSKSDFLRTQIVIPEKDSQKKIASILSALDGAIDATNTVIRQSERLKKGLTHTLFSGVASQGTLKSTAIGEMPEHWQVVKLDSVTTRGSGHTPDKKRPEYYNGGIKWVSLADTNKFDTGIINDTKTKISQLGIDNSSAVHHHAGSVVLSRDAGVGKSAILGDAMAVSQHFMVWRCDDKKLYNWFLYYYFQLKKREFERIAVGSTIKTIGLPYFKAMQIPLPPLGEQYEIADTLHELDEKIAINKKLKARQLKLKDGLMRDLLTGKVRV